MMSRTSSMPTDSRTNSGVTPVWTCSSGVSCEWVVRGRVNDQRLRVADVRQMAEQLDAVDQLGARRLAPLDAEADDRALLRRADISSRWHGRDDWAGPDNSPTPRPDAWRETRATASAFCRVPLQPQVQRLQAQQRQERCERDSGTPPVSRSQWVRMWRM